MKVIYKTESWTKTSVEGLDKREEWNGSIMYRAMKDDLYNYLNFQHSDEATELLIYQMLTWPAKRFVVNDFCRNLILQEIGKQHCKQNKNKNVNNIK